MNIKVNPVNGQAGQSDGVAAQSGQDQPEGLVSTACKNTRDLRLGAEITAYTNSGWLIATTFDYTFNGNRASGFQPGEGRFGPQKTIFRRLNGDWKISATIYTKPAPKNNG